jgi:DNA-directed RNA polymerase specialized sigma24 family protein
MTDTLPLAFLSRDNAAAALTRLSEADLLRLVQIARLLARGLADGDPQDLLNEAVLRVLEGSRRWRQDLPLVPFLAGIMRSLVEERWRRYRQDRLFRPLEDDTLDLVPSDCADPERELHARRYLARIDALFARDGEALAMVNKIALGMTPEQIRTALGLTPLAYATIRKRVRRALVRGFPEGSSP